jgi:hypothetical protein
LITDPIEIASVVTSSLGVIFTVYTLYRSLRIWNYSLRAEPTLRPIAMRRFVTQGWFLLMLTIICMCTTVSLWMPIGPLQALLRNTILSVLSLILTFRAAIDHWQHRASDPRHASRERETGAAETSQ